jgi:hypothetical protein
MENREPIIVPEKLRANLIRQIIRGKIFPADFPEVFPERKKIIVTLPEDLRILRNGKERM